MFTLPPWRDIQQEAQHTLALAWPVTLSHGANVLLAGLDTIMVGHYSSRELAYLGLGRSLAYITSMVCFGLISGILVKASHAQGAKQYQQAGQIWQAGIVFALILGFLSAALLCLLGPWLLHIMQVQPELIPGAEAFLRTRALGIPAMIGLFACSAFLEGLSKPRLVMVVILSMVVVNFIINWFLIAGQCGAPQMGATGAALGTATAEWLGLAAFLVLILTRMHQQGYQTRKWQPGLKERVKELAQFGLPFGIAGGLEMGGFTALSLMAGRLGALTSSGFEVLWGLALSCFALIIGFGSATSVRVGTTLGQGTPERVARVGWTGLVLGELVIGLVALALLWFPDIAAAAFSNDPAVLALATPFIPLLGITLLFDVAQFTFMFALRGAHDQWGASGLQIFSFWGVLVPLAAWLAFTCHLGLAGLSWGWLAGVLVASILLGGRFMVRCRTLVAQTTTASA